MYVQVGCVLFTYLFLTICPGMARSKTISRDWVGLFARLALVPDLAGFIIRADRCFRDLPDEPDQQRREAWLASAELDRHCLVGNHHLPDEPGFVDWLSHA